MARLDKTKAGTWRVRHYDGTRNAAGRLVERVSQTFAHKGDAMAELRRIELVRRARKEARHSRPGRVLTLAALIDLWGKHARASGIARDARVREVTHVLDRLAKARGWTLVPHVTAPSVAQWRSERGGTGTDKPLAMLKSVLRYGATTLRQAVDPGVLDLPGRRGVRRRASPDLLTPEQIAALIARARARGGDECAMVVEHLATYGCRPVDVCRLRVRDFNRNSGRLTLRDTKNGETITHDLLQRHVEQYRALTAGRPGDDPLFRNRDGVAWRVDKSAGQLLDWYTANVSSHVVPRPQWGLYALKDYAISTMDRLGIDDRTKALFTGHLTLDVFQRYKTTNQERGREALGRMRPAGENPTPPSTP